MGVGYNLFNNVCGNLAGVLKQYMWQCYNEQMYLYLCFRLCEIKAPFSLNLIIPGI